MSHIDKPTAGGMTAPPASQSPARDEQDIAALLAAPCNIRMRQHGRMFTLYDEELGLTASGEDLHAAHAELMSQREKRLREFAALGILPWLPKPGESCASCPTPGVVVRLKPFFIKAAVVTLLFLGAVTVIGQGLGVAGRQLEEKISGVGSWTPEKMEHERARAHAFAEKLRPVLRELIFVFRDTPEESAAGTGDKGR